MNSFTPVSAQCRNQVLSHVAFLSLEPLEEVVRRVQIDRMVGILKTSPYVAMLSTSRTRILLLLIRDTSVVGSPCRCLFVDPSRGDVVSARMVFDASLFQIGTVMEGELIATQTEMLFLVTDLTLLHGQRPAGGFRRRREVLADIVQHGHICDPIFDDAQIIVKRLCDPKDLSPFLDMSPIPHASRFLTLHPCEDGRGLPVFRVSLPAALLPRPTPVAEPVASPDPAPSIETQLIPVRSVRERVMNVRRTDLPDVYEVLVRGSWILACLPTIATSHEMRRLFQGSVHTAVVRTRCTFNTAFGRWEPSPNSFPRTVETAPEDGQRTVTALPEC